MTKNNSQCSSFCNLLLLQFKRDKLLVVIMVFLITATSVFMGSLMTEALRRITQAILDVSWKSLRYAMLFLVVLIITNFLCTVFYRAIAFRLSREITVLCEDRVYEKYNRQEYWGNQDDALGQIRKNIPTAVNAFVNLLCSTYQTAVVLISGCLYAAKLNYIVLLISLLVTGLMLLFSYRALGNLKSLYEEFSIRQGNLYNRLWEQIQNREIARFLIPDRAAAPYVKESRRFLEITLHAKKIANRTDLFASFGSIIMILLVAVIGGAVVIQGKMQLSSLLALVLVIPIISSNLFGIPGCITNWKSMLGQTATITNFLREENGRNCKQDLIHRDIKRLSLLKLRFQYPDRDPLLTDITLELTTGFYCIAGVSGCGKSTFLRLIAKLLPYTEGEILVDGQSLNALNRESYWKSISLATQTPVILRDTLLFNIVMTEDDYDAARLESAIQDAQLNNFVENQSEGLHTILSPGTLSKGECQRISMARIFYRTAKLLLLDEITSALDPRSELAILQALKERSLKNNQIIVCISHRVPPLKIADQVIFFANGRIHEKATHQKLVETNDEYRKLLMEVTP